jgi:hypothetical protein
MLFDPQTALDSLASEQVAPPDEPLPSGFPRRGHLRSPASQRIARLAKREGLFGFHFEHRFALDIPDAWLAVGADPSPSSWSQGELPERKYMSFRHDLAVASFHPGHRGKWTSHELCHALVGFAWHPGASPFFHATAGRLAELLPVVLYYFLDEVRLRRCPDHAGGGPLYRAFCPACEAVAAFRPMEDEDRLHVADAARFLDRELAAVARSRRLGRPIAHRFGSLDLCSDGLAYAQAHGPRLGSPAMERFAALLVPDGGWSETLDALEARVVAVARAIAVGDPLPSLGGRRARWAAQDLGSRLLTVWSDTGGEVADAVLEFVDRLVGVVHGGTGAEARLDGAVASIQRDWAALTEDFELPRVEDVFAVGYPLGAAPVSHADQLRAGLRSVVPMTLELFGDAGVDPLDGFAPNDLATPRRANLGDRFADWLEGPVRHLAAVETAIRAVRADPLVGALGSGEPPYELAEGARIATGPEDLFAVLEGVETGECAGRTTDRGLSWRPEVSDDLTWAAVIGRDVAGELVVAQLEPEDAAAIGTDALDPDIASSLADLGLLRGRRF